jgi:hypothetical protein
VRQYLDELLGMLPVRYDAARPTSSILKRRTLLRSGDCDDGRRSDARRARRAMVSAA